MKEGIAARRVIQNNDKPRPEEKSAKPDLRAERVDEMRRKVAGLGNLRISAEEGEKTRAPSFDEDDSAPLMTLSPAYIARPPEGKGLRYWFIYIGAGTLTLGWLAFCATYAFIHPETFTLAPAELGTFLAGVFAPPALFWLVASAMNRRADVAHYSYALRSELHRLLFPNDASESLFNQDVQRLVQQAAEISAASRAVLKSVQRARHALRVEARDYVGVAKKTEFHIDRLAEGLNERGAKLLALTAEIEQRTAQIDAKAQAGAESWDSATLKILERAGTIEAAMGQGAEKILAAAERANDKTREIKTHMADSYDALNKAVDEVAERLSKLTARFDGQVDGLTEVEKALAEKTESLGGLIKDQLGDLRSVTDDALLAMSRSGEMIKEQKEGFDRGARVFADQARQIGEIVTNSVGGLNESVDRLIEKGVSLEEKLGQRSQELQGLTVNLSKQSEAIDRAGASAAAKLDESLALAATGSEAIHASVRRAADLIETALKDSRRNIGEIDQASASAIEKLSEAAGSLEEKLRRAENISTSSQERFEEIGALIGKRAAQLTESGRDLLGVAENAQALETRFAKIHGDMKEVSALSGAVGEKADSLNVALEKNRASLEALGGETLAQLENLENALRAADHGLDTRASALRTQSEASVRAVKDVNTALDQSIEKLAASRQAGAELDETVALLEKDARNLLSALEETQERVSRAGLDANEASGAAYEKIRLIAAALADREEELRGVSSLLEDKIGGVQQRMQDQFQELTSSVGLAVEMMDETGVEFARQAKVVEDTAERVAGGFTRAGLVAREESEKLDKSAELASQRTARQAANLREEIRSLLDQGGMLGELEKTGEVLSRRAAEFARAMQEALSASHGFNKELKVQSHAAALAAQESAEKVGRAVETLARKSEEIGNAANAALQSAREATSGFGKQSEALFKAAQDAGQRVEELRAMESGARREGFLETAKFLFEKLHSLSIDITRMVEGEVPEKTWRAYQSGDLAAFTRRLAELKGEVPMDRARAKYIKDAEFRAYVQKFARQFEETYAQAEKVDHKDILCAALASSDVGKVYVFVCAVAGMKPVFEPGLSKVA